MTQSKRRFAAVLAALASVAAMALPASAGARAWVIRGHGFGHGVGMSQWGAYGLARHGAEYGPMLHRYYQGTHLVHRRARSVRVLLGSGLGSVGFTGAGKACGHNLSRGRTYELAGGSGISLASSSGRRIDSCGSTAWVSKGPVHVLGTGTYRGRLVTRAHRGIELVNRLGVESYVKGVVPNEMPSSWPQAALRAQAVAARTYAIDSESGGGTFDVYDDTRSQVYRGKGSETAATNRAVAASKHRVVDYRGRLATTYYFSTSGGQTEDVQNAFIGSTPEPYLVGVRDPYDSYSPEHSWRVVRSTSAMAAALSGLYQGSLRRVRVLRHGASPRIVSAKVVGSGGSSKASGPTLESRLGLMSTWERFKRVRGSAAAVRARLGSTASEPAPPGPPRTAGAGP
jgi:stage II sporulation protein D